MNAFLLILFFRSYLKHCRKIGEGVYGEVFLYENGDEKNVIKIIPIEGEMDVNNERQKKFDEILSEIVIAKSVQQQSRSGIIGPVTILIERFYLLVFLILQRTS